MRNSAGVENLAWCLPRPRRVNLVPGCFPAFFERKLMRLLDTPERVLQPFGGLAEYGIRMDIRREVSPDVVGDAHVLPFLDGAFDMALLDPPYSEQDAHDLYGTGRVRILVAAREAVRVVREGGWVVLYHELSLPGPPHCVLTHRILVETRNWHVARIVHVYRKDTATHHARSRRLGRSCQLGCAL